MERDADLTASTPRLNAFRARDANWRARSTGRAAVIKIQCRRALAIDMLDRLLGRPIHPYAPASTEGGGGDRQTIASDPSSRHLQHDAADRRVGVERINRPAASFV